MRVWADQEAVFKTLHLQSMVSKLGCSSMEAAGSAGELFSTKTGSLLLHLVCLQSKTLLLVIAPVKICPVESLSGRRKIEILES